MRLFAKIVFLSGLLGISLTAISGLVFERGDTKTIEEFFEVAKQRRDAWVDGSNASPE